MKNPYSVYIGTLIFIMVLNYYYIPMYFNSIFMVHVPENMMFYWSSFVFIVGDLQEEGKKAINAPLLHADPDLLPEDTLLGNIWLLLIL